MGKIADLVNSGRRLLTQQQLRDLVGRPFSDSKACPCPSCGNGLLAVLQDGSLLCEECQPSNGKTIAFRAYPMTLPNGETVMGCYSDLLEQTRRGREGSDENFQFGPLSVIAFQASPSSDWTFPPSMSDSQRRHILKSIAIIGW